MQNRTPTRAPRHPKPTVIMQKCSRADTAEPATVHFCMITGRACLARVDPATSRHKTTLLDGDSVTFCRLAIPTCAVLHDHAGVVQFCMITNWWATSAERRIAEGQRTIRTEMVWMTRPARPPTTVPLILMNCRSRPTWVSINCEVSSPSQR